MKKFLPLALVLVLSVFAIFPLFGTGFFRIHDDTQIARVQEMALSLRDGQLPVRWVNDLGYGFGYPIFNFYGPLAYYFGGLFVIFGLSPLVATKIVFALALVFCGVSMYALASRFWGKMGGVLASIFYVYAPYHALDAYVRGALGELWAISFVPLVFLGVYEVFVGNNVGIFIGSLGLAAMIVSHNLTAIIIVPTLMIMIFLLTPFSSQKIRFLSGVAVLLIIGAGLSSFYWLPSVGEMNFTKVSGQIGGGADFRDHFVYLDQLWASPWGFGGSAPGRLDGMSFMAGKIHLIAVAICFPLALFFYLKKRHKAFFTIICGLILLFLSLFMITDKSMFIWASIKPMAYVQYPWRYLLSITFFASFLAGSLACAPFAKKEWRFLAFTLLLLVVIGYNKKYFNTPNYYEVENGKLSLNDIKWRISRISDEYLPKDFVVPVDFGKIPASRVEIISGKGKISNLLENSKKISFSLFADTDLEAKINIAYFPGWEIADNGVSADFVLEEGRVVVDFSPGWHNVELYFVNTRIRKIGNFTSLLSMGLLALFMLKFRNGRA